MELMLYDECLIKIALCVSYDLIEKLSAQHAFIRSKGHFKSKKTLQLIPLHQP